MAEAFSPSPLDDPSFGDPGDDTQRRFRYQHAYGVILLAEMVAGRKNYRALVCEHQEDLLAERPDELFESYIIKTRELHRKPWCCTDDDLVRSVGSCVELDRLFPGRLAAFHFVSNAPCLDGNRAKPLEKSPTHLKRAVSAVDDLAALPEPFKGVVQGMATGVGAAPEKVFDVWKRFFLLRGPSLDAFDAVVAHEYLAKIPGCTSHGASRLDALRDELMQRVLHASSLAMEGASRHLICAAAPGKEQPRLLAKRITLEGARQVLFSTALVPFRFSPPSTPVQIGDASTGSEILEKKLIKGGLGAHVERMQRWKLSAERHLLELQYSRPDEVVAIMDQLDGVVSGEAEEAQLLASAKPEPYGEEMLRLLILSLKQRAKERPETVFAQEYECLMGFVGSLTHSCRVWWSSKFDVLKPL